MDATLDGVPRDALADLSIVMMTRPLLRPHPIWRRRARDGMSKAEQSSTETFMEFLEAVRETFAGKHLHLIVDSAKSSMPKPVSPIWRSTRNSNGMFYRPAPRI
ncbi:MAG: hypothetical protein M1493_01200 [Firmicutes bacterium]|jgi:hypothetical protein|uniref:Uncharacterized protein n=1 Tax=Sulfobacillus benefaciens TaxID=453960 RepID=A0A2T2X799_9FIRM|nr:hypothetical protein [Bacillota bacterium]PSR30326.1 MAG: hypothetical protein C7B43_06315 [Sulfobacillus benefaciens]